MAARASRRPLALVGARLGRQLAAAPSRTVRRGLRPGVGGERGPWRLTGACSLTPSPAHPLAHPNRQDVAARIEQAHAALGLSSFVERVRSVIIYLPEGTRCVGWVGVLGVHDSPSSVD